MDELQKIWEGEQIGGEYNDFKSLFVNNDQNQREFYDDLKKEQKTDLGYDQFKAKYFNFTPAVDEKKNGASPPVSSQPSETVSGGTPTEPVSPAEPPLAEDLGRIWDRFRQVGNETRVAAQQATMDKIEAQPLSRRMADWYANTLSPGARERVEEGRWTGDDVDINKLWHKVNSDTPEAAQIEAELQKIYKETDPADRRSLENAAIDAKQVMLSHMNPKTARKSWDDLAQTMANFEEYDPQGYHERLNKQIVERYKETGMDERDAYRNLMGSTLDEGVMDEERTREAQVGFQIMNWKDAVVKAVRKGDGAMVEFAGRKLEEAEAAEKALRDQRLSAVDEEIGRMQYLLAMDSPPAPRADLRAEIKRLEGVKAGFINPDARIQAAYAKYETPARQALPQGTPMEQLRKLYAEIAWDRKQVAKRVWAAEGGDGPVEYALKNMANSFGGGGHNADHRKLVQLDAQLKDLAPIVFLNESPAMQDRKAGFGPSAWNGLLNTIGGKGSPMSGTSRQEDALALARNLQIAGVAPEVLNDPSMAGISDRTREPGLRDAEYWGNLLGTSGGLMFHIMMAQQGTNALGMGSAINKLIGAEKYGGAILPLLGDAVESGLNYNLAGMASVDNKDELSFMGGFFGGAAGSLGKNGFDGAKKAVAGLFGDRGAEAARVIADFGAQRLGAGVGESFEETGQQLVQMWNQSNTGQEFWEKFGKQFGDVPELVKFYVSTMAMGMFMGGAHSDGLGKYMRDYAGDQLEGMPPLERRIAEELTGQIEEESRDLIEGAQGGGGTQNGEEAPAMELTPEAQAAQEELKKRRELDRQLGSQGNMSGYMGTGSREASGLSEDEWHEQRIREDLQALKDKEQGINQPTLSVNEENPNSSFVDRGQGLSEAEKARMQHLETVVAGLDQMRDQAASREVTPAPEVSTQTETTEASEESVDNATPSNTVDIDGVQIELPTIEGLNAPQAPVSETATPVSEPVAPSVEPVQETQQPPKRRDQEISDQINEFFNGLAGSIGEAAAKKIKEYADRIIAGESRESIIQNIPEKWVEAIDQAVELKRNAQQEGAQEETAVEQPAAEQSPAPIEVGNEIEYMQGPQSNRTKKKGKVTAIRPDGKYEVEIEVGGQKTTTVVSDENVVRETPAPPVVEQTTTTETVTPETPTEAQGAGETIQQQTTPPVQQPSIEMDALAVADLGRQVANALVEAGKYTRENWLKAMDTYGPIVAPHLDRAWQSVSKAVPEGTKAAGKTKAGPPKGGKKKKKSKSKPRTTKTGTQLLIEKYISTASNALKEVVTNTPLVKDAYNQAQKFKGAVTAVKKAIGDGTVGGMMARLKKPSTTENVDRDQFQRMSLVRMYGAMADAATKARNEAMLAGDQAAAEQHQKDADTFNRNMSAMLMAFSENALGAGRGGAASAMWQQLGGAMDVYALGVMDRANREIMAKAKASNGKPLEEAINDGVANINNAAMENADEIANATDGVTEQAANESKPKKKETTVLGMTRAEARAAKKKALEEFNSIHLSGTANAMLAPNGFAKTIALAKVGFYAMAEGAIAFNDWVANMKRTVAGITDQELRDAWEANVNGRTLAEESEILMRQRALDSITRTLESTGTSENSETARETKKIRDAMAKELTRIIEDGGTLEDFKKKYGLTDQQAEDLAEAILNATPEALDKLAGNRAKARKVQFAAESYLPKEKRAQTKEQRTEMARKREVRLKVKETIRDHFKAPDGRPLIDKLVEAGLDLEQARKVEEAVKQNAQRILEQAVAGELDHIASNESKRKNKTFKPPKKGKQRTQTQVLIDALVDGQLSNTYLQGMLAHRFGMSPAPTPEQVARIRKLGEAVARLPEGNIRNKAMRELAVAIGEIMPRGKGEALVALYSGLIFPSTLNSLATFGINVSSVFDHYLLGMVKPLVDPMQYIDFIKAVISGNRNAMLLNPIAKVIVKAGANIQPFKAGFQAFLSGVKTGVTSSRYDESIMESDPRRMLPELERKPGSALARFLLAPRWWNPYSHIFGKLVGRLLSATDAATTMMYGDLEFLDALRMAAGNQNKSWSQLRKEMGEYLSMDSQLWRDSLARAETEARIVEDATGKPVPEATIKTRAREIAREAFSGRAGITEEELRSVRRVAQYNTMTEKRGGTFGKLATAISKAKNSSPIARALLFPFFLFTEIPGNFGDAMLDNTPVWNMIRLLGISPTSIVKRLGKSETSARMGDSWNSRERRKQIEAAAFSTILMGGAYALLKLQDDDDDDKITGKEQNQGDSYKLFGISFKNFASIAPALIMAKFLDDYDKSPESQVANDLGGFFGRIVGLGGALGTFYTEQSFVKGIRDLGTTTQGIFRTIGNEGSFESKAKGVLKSIVRPYLNTAMKPLPTAQGIVRFMQDVIDPHKHSEESMKEFFMYSIGLQHFTNERKVDIFGEEIYVLPGDNVIPVQGLLNWFTGKQNPNKDLYKFLAKTNTYLEAPSNSVIKFIDKDSPTGFTIRDFNPDEWKAYNVEAGKLFAESLRGYMKGQPDDDVKIKGAKYISATQKDIAKLWTDAKGDAKDNLFGKGKKFPAIATDSEAQNLLDEFLGQ